MCATLICTPSSLLKPRYAPNAETLFRTPLSLCVFPSRSAIGRPGPETAACRPEGSASTAEVRCTGQALLGVAARALARMETGLSPHAAGDSGWVAQGRIQTLLEVVIPSSPPWW